MVARTTALFGGYFTISLLVTPLIRRAIRLQSFDSMYISLWKVIENIIENKDHISSISTSLY